MASVDGYNAVAPPSKPADSNTAFADALKRAKEVRGTFRKDFRQIEFTYTMFSAQILDRSSNGFHSGCCWGVGYVDEFTFDIFAEGLYILFHT